jgi:hypothetical protein
MAMTTRYRPHEVVAEGHPSAESRDILPNDQRLRRNGFEIVSRPALGPNMWGLGRETDGRPEKKLPENEALGLCERWEREFEEAVKSKEV